MLVLLETNAICEIDHVASYAMKHGYRHRTRHEHRHVDSANNLSVIIYVGVGQDYGG
jgi:hypothetical protein